MLVIIYKLTDFLRNVKDSWTLMKINEQKSKYVYYTKK